MIYYGHQHITREDIDAVKSVLDSPYLTQGPVLEEFEKRVAEYCGVNYAVAVTNATSALHIACRVLGLEKGDYLWTSPITFTASANCGRYCGADVDFVDIDNDTYNMSVEKLEKKLKYKRSHGECLPKIVVPVHLAGQSCNMKRIYELAKEYGFFVIEDASHAIGAEYFGSKVGSCRYSDMAVLSFHPVKIITTGEGGMVLTNNKELFEDLKLLRSHGITRNEALMTKEIDGPWYYQQIELGYNYRMTDIQAALGCSQLEKLDGFVSRRRYLAERYNVLLSNFPLKLPYQHPETCSSWHLYIVRLDFNRINKSKKEIFIAMKNLGVMLNVHYIPVHLQPYYNDLGFNEGDYEISEQYYREAFTLPLYYDLTDTQQDFIVECLRSVLL